MILVVSRFYEVELFDPHPTGFKFKVVFLVLCPLKKDEMHLYFDAKTFVGKVNTADSARTLLVDPTFHVHNR